MDRSTAQQLAAYERRYAELAAQVADIGYIRAGSLALRHNRCGKPACRCHADPPQLHDPYWQWTAKIAGKTVNRRLTQAQAELYTEWIDNNRRLHALIQQMREIAEKATELRLTQAAEVQSQARIVHKEARRHPGPMGDVQPKMHPVRPTLGGR